MKHTQFLVFGSMIALGSIIIGSTSAALTISNNYQINGPYANSGFITDGDSIHYTINYSGVNADISGGIIAEYNGAIGTGACFSNISLSSSGSITFFDENNQALSGGLDCTTRSFHISMINNLQNKISVAQGPNIGWYGYINNNLEATYQIQNSSTNQIELYIWNGSQSVFIDQSQNANWYSSLNSNGQGIYQIQNSSTNENELYMWDGTQSVLVDSGQNTYWQPSYNNNANFNYQKYNSSTNEYELYIWDGVLSSLVDSGQSANWSSNLNENGQGSYQKYNSLTNKNELYIWDGSQSVLVDSEDSSWQSALNNNTQGTYQRYNSSTNEYELYLWNGSQSSLIASGQNATWYGTIINQNNQATYQKYNSLTNEYELYLWNGFQSVFVDAGENATWYGTINNNGQNQYKKYNSSTNQTEFYIWNGFQSVFIDAAQGISWNTNLNNNGEAQYQKYNSSTNENELYTWDGSQSSLIYHEVNSQRYGYMDDYGHIQYQKYNGSNGEFEIYIVDSNQQINGSIEYDILIQSGVTQNNIPYITTSGSYNNELSGNNFVYQHNLYYPLQQSHGSGFAGGGNSTILEIDNCPNGDNSHSYYDKTCGGSKDGTGNNTIIEDIENNNITIQDGYCYSKKKDITIIDSSITTTSKEFKQALEFMYAYGMTIHNTIDEFKPNDNLTREQAAKIFTNFATNVLCRPTTDESTIEYLDIQDADANFVPYIRQAYTLGLMKGGKDNKFRPKDTITKAELNATIIRMILQSDLPEDTGSKRYDEYNKVSQQLGIIKKQGDNSPVIRKFASLMFFRAYKNQAFSLQKTNDKESFVLDSRDKFIK